MRYLYFSPFATDCLNASVLLEDAFNLVNKDTEAEVYFIYLDYPGILMNDFNSERSKFRNFEINFDNKLLLSKNKHHRIYPIPFSKLKPQKFSNDYQFNSLEEVKSLSYENINIGYGVVSSFVSFTRNIDPQINDVVKKYIQDYLNSNVSIIESLIRFISSKKIEYIKSFNGRYATLRAPIDIARAYKIPFSTLETLPCHDEKGIKYKYFEYKNDVPHSIALRTEIINNLWNKEDEINPQKYTDFFERRAHGLKAGDKVYVGNQSKGLLPKTWNINKRNFVFFTSSEDEFFSIGEEWEKLRLFSDQIEAAKELAKICQEDYTIQLYIRIHPNLISIPYKYAKFVELYNLPNVTVIPAESPISTYQLLFACEKCFTMGSTMGVEATYWNKPSILLNGSFYYYLNVAYIPRTIEQLKELLLKKNLPPKNKVGCYKYAKSIMDTSYGFSPRFVDFTFNPIRFKGKVLHISNSMTIWGSHLLYKLSVLVFRMLYLKSKKTYLSRVFPYMLIER